MQKIARMIKDHLQDIINAIILKRTNAIAESVTSRVQKIKARACGYRNHHHLERDQSHAENRRARRSRFRNAIPFICGKLDLWLSTRKTEDPSFEGVEVSSTAGGTLWAERCAILASLTILQR